MRAKTYYQTKEKEINTKGGKMIANVSKKINLFVLAFLACILALGTTVFANSEFFNSAEGLYDYTGSYCFVNNGSGVYSQVHKDGNMYISWGDNDRLTVFRYWGLAPEGRERDTEIIFDARKFVQQDESAYDDTIINNVVFGSNLEATYSFIGKDGNAMSEASALKLLGTGRTDRYGNPITFKQVELTTDKRTYAIRLGFSDRAVISGNEYIFANADKAWCLGGAYSGVYPANATVDDVWGIEHYAEVNVAAYWFSSEKKLIVAGSGAMRDALPKCYIEQYMDYGMDLSKDRSPISATLANEEFELVMSDGITNIGVGMFEDCAQMTIGRLSEDLTQIKQYGFANCSGETGNLIIPESVTNIGDHAFSGCSGFDGELTLPSGLTSIGNYAFDSCDHLTGDLVIPDSVTSIGQQAFYGCSGFDGTLTIPDNITSIEQSTFNGCCRLTGTLTIPQNVTNIDGWAFCNCPNLTKIIYNGGDALTSIGEDAFRVDSPVMTSLETNSDVLTNYDWESDNRKILGSITINDKTYNLVSANKIWQVGDSANAFWFDEDKCIVVDGTGDMWNFYGEDPLYMVDAGIDPEDVESAAIADGITSVGGYAFHECNNLASIYLPNSITMISGHAFFRCENLLAISMPSGLETIEENAFHGCEKLVISPFPDSLTTIEEYAFAGCPALVSIAGGNNVNDIGVNAFYYGASPDLKTYLSTSSPALTGYDWGNNNREIISATNSWDISKNGDGTVMAFWSEGTKTLEIIGTGEIKDYNCETSPFNGTLNYKEFTVTMSDDITHIGDWLFVCKYRNDDEYGTTYAYYCPVGMTVAKLPANLESIGDYAFDGGCHYTITELPDGLKSIGETAFGGNEELCLAELPDSLEDIGDDAFNNCDGVSINKLPDSLSMIGERAFIDCDGIKSITIPDSITSIPNGLFSECHNLVRITGGDNVTSVGENAFMFLEYDDTSSLKTLLFTSSAALQGYDWATDHRNVFSSSSVEIRGTVYNFAEADKCWKVGDDIIAFWYDDDKKIVLYGTGDMYGFVSNNPLNLITNGIDTSVPESLIMSDGITNIGAAAFHNCTGLTGNLVIPDGVTSIGDFAFMDCSNLTGDLAIPDSVISIGTCAFSRCSGFTGNLVIPEGVTRIETMAFDSCSGFDGTVTIPEGVTRIEDCTFKDCTGFIGDLIIPDGVTIIGGAAFSGCSGFDGSLILPNSVTSIDEYAFRGCSGLTGCLIIPNSVISIGDCAFYECCGFNEKLVIPNDVTSIGWQAFSDCPGLTTVKYNGTDLTSIGSSAFHCNSTVDTELETDNSTLINYNWASDNRRLIKSVSINSVKYDITDRDPLDISAAGDGSILAYWLPDDGVLVINGSGAIKDYTECPFVSLVGSNAYDVVMSDSITNIGEYLFAQSNIKSIRMSDDLEDIGTWAFNNCDRLGNVTLPDGLKTIGFASFANNSQFNLPNGIPDTVTDIEESAFSNNMALCITALPTNLTSLGSHAFADCQMITEITLPNNVGFDTIMPGTFSGCGKLTKITGGNNVSFVGAQAFYLDHGSVETMVDSESTNLIAYEWEDDHRKLVLPPYKYWQYTLDDTNDIIVLHYYGVDNNGDVIAAAPTDVVIPSTMIINGKTYASRLYTGTWHNIPGAYNASGVSDPASYLISPFMNNPLITSVTVEAGVTINALNPALNTGMDWQYLFNNCTALKKVSLAGLTTPDGDNSIGTLSNAFTGCTSLTTLDTDDWTVSGGATMYETFKDCSSLKSLDFSAWNYTNLKDTSRVSDYQYTGLFDGCAELENLNVSTWDIAFEAVPDSMFKGCKKLIPAFGAQWNWDSCTEIGMSAFEGCESMTEFTIPSAVTEIGTDAFKNCKSLTSINYDGGNALTTIAPGAFAAEHNVNTKLNTNSALLLGYDWANDNRTLAMKYTIQYNANGGTFTSGYSTTQLKTYGVDLTLNGPAIKSKPAASPGTGISFEGWNTAENGTGTTYEEGCTLSSDLSSVDGAVVNLYAKWETHPAEYTLTYDSNGGSFTRNGAVPSQTKKYGVNLALYASTDFDSVNPPVITGNNVTFKEWNTAANGSGTSFAEGATMSTDISSTDGDAKTLYAIWNKTPITYTVAYDKNGGSGTIASQTKTYGTALPLKTNGFTAPTETGYVYTFKEWNTQADGNGTAYASGDSMTGDLSTTQGETKTLYAIWAKTGITYTVAYDANGGSGTTESQTKTYGTSLNIRTNGFTAPAETGYAYSFKEWNTQADGLGTSYGTTLSSDLSNIQDDTVTLYAIWDKSKVTYTIHYDSNGGSGDIEDQTKAYGENITLRENTLTSPVNAGYEYSFDEWNMQADGEGDGFEAGSVLTRDLSNTDGSTVTLYAIWNNAPITYTIAYDANGGSGNVEAQEKTYGTPITIRANEFTAPDDGKLFGGWNTKVDGSGDTYAPDTVLNGDLSTNKDDTVTLYAIWTDIIRYTIAYDANGGSGTVESHEKTTGENIVLRENDFTAPSDGEYEYSFKEWNTKADGTGMSFGNGTELSAELSVIDGDTVTLYAIWKKTAKEGTDAVRYTITYDANGGTGTVEAQEKTVGRDLVLRTNGFTAPIEDDCIYSFREWNTQADGTGEFFGAGSTLTTDLATEANDTVTLYAIWDKDAKEKDDAPPVIHEDAENGYGNPNSDIHNTDATDITTVSSGNAKYAYDAKQTNVLIAAVKADISPKFAYVVSDNKYVASAKHRYKVSNKKLAKVNKKGIINPKKAGTIEIQLEQKVKGSGWEAIGNPIKLYIQKPVMQKKDKETAEAGKTIDAFKYLSRTTYAPTTWKSSKSSVATVDENGKITILKKGSVKIIAVYSNGNYSSKKKYKTTIKISG